MWVRVVIVLLAILIALRMSWWQRLDETWGLVWACTLVVLGITIILGFARFYCPVIAAEAGMIAERDA